MKTAGLERGSDGTLRLVGPLVFVTVPGLYERLRAETEAVAGEVVVDLAEVSRADSAGLALLLECLRIGRRHGTRVRFLNVPPQLRAMIRVAGLERAFFEPESAGAARGRGPAGDA